MKTRILIIKSTRSLVNDIQYDLDSLSLKEMLSFQPEHKDLCSVCKGEGVVCVFHYPLSMMPLAGDTDRVCHYCYGSGLDEPYHKLA